MIYVILSTAGCLIGICMFIVALIFRKKLPQWGMVFLIFVGIMIIGISICWLLPCLAVYTEHLPNVS